MRAEGLGHAERVGAGHLGADLLVLRQQRGEGAAPDGRQVALLEARVVHQRLGHVRPTEHLGDPLALDEPERGAGLELLLEDERGPGVHGGDQGEAEPAHPEQRHRRVEHVLGDEVPHLPEVVGVAHRGAVGVHRPLRIRGAAGRVHDHHRVGRGDLGFTLLQKPARDGVAPARQLGDRSRPATLALTPGPHGAEVGVRRQEDPLVALVGQAGDGLFEAVEVVVAEVGVDREEHLGVSVAEDPAQLLGLAVGVQQDGHPADAGDPEPAEDPLGAVGGEEPHAGALASTGGQQPLGDGGRLLLRLGVGEAGVAEHGEGLVAEARRAGTDELPAGGREVRKAGIEGHVGILRRCGRRGRPSSGP